MGKKYIIEMKEHERLYKAKLDAFNGPVIQEIAGAPYTEPDIEQVRKEAYEDGFKNAVHNCPEGCPYVEHARNGAYQRGYEQGYKDGYNEPGKNQQEAYQRGLNDAWEAARKIALDKEDGGLDTVAYCEIFGYGKGFGTILKKFSASEAIEKIRQYEQEKRFCVGDEFENESGKRFVILKMDGTEIDRYIDEEGNTYCMIAKYKVMRKTGRYFPEIAAVLEKMRGEQDG